MSLGSATAIQGVYRDRLVEHPDGFVDRGWRCNRIVDNCHRLLSALMKGETGIQGVLYLALGAGEAAWDDDPPEPPADAVALSHEWLRQPVLAEQMVYLDAADQPSPTPTDRLEITLSFNGADLVSGGVQSLREFGLYGGDATDAADSGYLINYVIHPRIDFTPRATLVRQLRLQFGVAPLLMSGVMSGMMRAMPLKGSSGTGGTAGSMLGSAPLKYLDGIGDTYAQTLELMGLTTIGELAEADLDTADVTLPRTRLVELQAKAVLALNSAASVPAVQALARERAGRVATSSTAALMSRTGAPETSIAAARAQAAALQLALDDRFLARNTLEELTRPLDITGESGGLIK